MNNNEFVDLTKTVPVSVLLEIGKRIVPTDFAIRFYRNKNHPKFYNNRFALEKSVRRAFEIGAFDHRRQAMDILERYIERSR